MTIPEGVIVVAGNGGVLVPLIDGIERQTLVDFVNARAASPMAVRAPPSTA